MTRQRLVPPARDGVGPSCIGLPVGAWPALLDFLAERFPAVGRDAWQQRMRQGNVIDEQGMPLDPACPYPGRGRIYYYRAVAHEPRIPFDEVVLFQDEQLVVVDKPHFLPVIPSGDYLQETVLVRLKRKLGIDTLAPIHRIDRDTAGLVMFCVQPAHRGHYNALFRERAVHKSYEAIAPWRADLQFPLTHQSRIVEAGHFMLQQEVSGPPNAITQLAVKAVRGALAHYALQPVTGQRHQLRVHMAALGIPILGDGLYPTLTPKGQLDYEHPLQLLAKRIEFFDPLSGQRRCFESERRLQLPR